MTHGAFTSVCLAKYKVDRDDILEDLDDEVPDEDALEDVADKGLFFERMDYDLSHGSEDEAKCREILDRQIGFLGEVSFEAESYEDGGKTGRMTFVLTIPKGKLRDVVADEMSHFSAVFNNATLEEFCGAEIGDGYFYEAVKMVSSDGWQDSIIDTTDDGYYPEPWFSWVGLNLKRNDERELKYRVIAVFNVGHE